MTIYEDLNIYELRHVARKVGVRSPSTLKKKEIILQIENISSGKTKPFVKKTNQGRPIKEFKERVFDFMSLVENKKKEISKLSPFFKNFSLFLKSLKNFNEQINKQIDTFLEENKDFFS
ncbi:MAG: Rho termination factor N-terminal domain-containing protein [Christensenellales bacterium]